MCIRDRADADLDYAVANLVDGAFFNSGQCCCGIERIYVHESRYDAFVDGFVDLTKQYKDVYKRQVLDRFFKGRSGKTRKGGAND